MLSPASIEAIHAAFHQGKSQPGHPSPARALRALEVATDAYGHALAATSLLSGVETPEAHEVRPARAAVNLARLAHLLDSRWAGLRAQVERHLRPVCGLAPEAPSLYEGAVTRALEATFHAVEVTPVDSPEADGLLALAVGLARHASRTVLEGGSTHVAQRMRARLEKHGSPQDMPDEELSAHEADAHTLMEYALL